MGIEVRGSTQGPELARRRLEVLRRAFPRLSSGLHTLLNHPRAGGTVRGGATSTVAHAHRRSLTTITPPIARSWLQPSSVATLPRSKSSPSPPPSKQASARGELSRRALTNGRVSRHRFGLAAPMAPIDSPTLGWSTSYQAGSSRYDYLLITPCLFWSSGSEVDELAPLQHQALTTMTVTTRPS